MTTKYFALLTNQGAAKLANAAALGSKVNITSLGVGDGGGTLPTPDAAQTKLIGEKRRAQLNSLTVDAANSSQIIAEQIIPESEGGFWIREIGLYDADGVLIAIANCPETYKPQLAEGSGRTQTVRMILIVNSTAAVTLKIDPSVVLATRRYVDEAVIEVKAYADSVMKKHTDADNPHGQYLQIANALAEIKDAGLVSELLKNIGISEKFTGRLLRTVVMTVSGNYTPDPAATKVLCQIVGAGASGSSPPSVNSATYTAAGGGGGGGGFVEFEIDQTIAKLKNVAVMIGLGGAAVTGSTGIRGGNTMFGSKIIAYGGSQGYLATRPRADYSNTVSSLMVIAGLGGNSEYKETSAGYRLIRKGNGCYGGWGYLGTQGQLGGCGGASELAGETSAAGNKSNGANGTDAGYGAGGSGTCNLYDDSNPDATAYNAKLSGSGADGVAIFYEYA
ncbi:phage tail protein [Pantoea vagans]|nr:phage tail protein [Pantoea vagans]